MHSASGCNSGATATANGAKGRRSLSSAAAHSARGAHGTCTHGAAHGTSTHGAAHGTASYAGAYIAYVRYLQKS